jgi:hypothetical protein
MCAYLDPSSYHVLLYYYEIYFVILFKTISILLIIVPCWDLLVVLLLVFLLVYSYLPDHIFSFFHGFIFFLYLCLHWCTILCAVFKNYCSYFVHIISSYPVVKIPIAVCHYIAIFNFYVYGNVIMFSI